MDFTHFNEHGRARMVNVSEKKITKRVAVAKGMIHVSENTIALIKSGGIPKGDVLAVAQVAGIMAAKSTFSIIPMCHNIVLEGADISFAFAQNGIEITASVETTGKTGAEMEALSAVSTAALTIYDMCKAVDKGMVISEIRLVSKTGGKSDIGGNNG